MMVDDQDRCEWVPAHLGRTGQRRKMVLVVLTHC